MQSRRHTLVEAVTALVLLVIVVSAIATTLKAAGTARLRTTQTARSLLVLENVSARLPARSSWTQAEISQLLEAELAAITIPKGNGLVPMVEPKDNTLRLSIEDVDGRPLARINVPLNPEVAP